MLKWRAYLPLLWLVKVLWAVQKVELVRWPVHGGHLVRLTDFEVGLRWVVLVLRHYWGWLELLLFVCEVRIITKVWRLVLDKLLFGQLQNKVVARGAFVLCVKRFLLLLLQRNILWWPQSNAILTRVIFLLAQFIRLLQVTRVRQPLEARVYFIILSVLCKHVLVLFTRSRSIPSNQVDRLNSLGRFSNLWLEGVVWKILAKILIVFEFD